MNILIFAPHQDDEILSAGILIHRCIQSGDEVFVAFATNGDYQGRDTALLRYHESLSALQLLQFNANHIFYLGYGDTGMRYHRSFLYRLFYRENDQILPSRFSEATYHPAGLNTIHRICTGQEAPYLRSSFLEDLGNLLDLCNPDIVVLPSVFDQHGDHCACYLFMKELLQTKKRHIQILTYLTHAGDDQTWPNREGVMFQRPACVSSSIWKKRIKIHISDEEKELKEHCIHQFHTQKPNAVNAYLLSFLKCEEVFLPFEESYPTINIFPWQR